MEGEGAGEIGDMGELGGLGGLGGDVGGGMASGAGGEAAAAGEVMAGNLGGLNTEYGGDIAGTMGDVGGITGGLGVSIGDLEAAMAAQSDQGTASYGGQVYEGVIGGVPDYGATGPTGFGYGEHAGTSPGAPADFNGAFSGVADTALGALVASMNGYGGITGVGAFGTGGQPGQGIGSLANPGGISDVANTNLADFSSSGPANIDMAAALGINDIGNPAVGSTAGVPAETFAGGTAPSFADDFGSFTDSGQGVSVANSAAASPASSDAMTEIASPASNASVQGGGSVASDAEPTLANTSSGPASGDKGDVAATAAAATGHNGVSIGDAALDVGPGQTAPSFGAHDANFGGSGSSATANGFAGFSDIGAAFDMTEAAKVAPGIAAVLGMTSSNNAPGSSLLFGSNDPLVKALRALSP